MVEAQFHKQLDFQVRYIVNLYDEPQYYLHVVVAGSTGQNSEEEHDEAVIVERGRPEESEQRMRFRQTIHALTLQLQSMGKEATIKSFMML